MTQLETNEFANKGDTSHDVRDKDTSSEKEESDKHSDNHDQGMLRF
jgi:hypothetical protein